jgi:hypothetical protein
MTSTVPSRRPRPAAAKRLAMQAQSMKVSAPRSSRTRSEASWASPRSVSKWCRAARSSSPATMRRIEPPVSALRLEMNSGGAFGGGSTESGEREGGKESGHLGLLGLGNLSGSHVLLPAAGLTSVMPSSIEISGADGCIEATSALPAGFGRASRGSYSRGGAGRCRAGATGALVRRRRREARCGRAGTVGSGDGDRRRQLARGLVPANEPVPSAGRMYPFGEGLDDEPRDVPNAMR